jgi:annexin A7/11
LVDGLPGFGCDSTAVINILTHRDSVQRGYIQQEYRNMYHEELSQRISSELSGNHKARKAFEEFSPY